MVETEFLTPAEIRPLADGKTCDAPLCPEHATEVGKDRHYCPRHVAESRAQAPELF